MEDVESGEETISVVEGWLGCGKAGPPSSGGEPLAKKGKHPLGWGMETGGNLEGSTTEVHPGGQGTRGAWEGENTVEGAVVAASTTWGTVNAGSSGSASRGDLGSGLR